MKYSRFNAPRGLALTAALIAAAALSGCATSLRVDSDVQSFSSLSTDNTVRGPATYRFDRLPSQQSSLAQQTALEAMAAPALAQAGLVRDDANPRYNVQIGAQLQALTANNWDGFPPYRGWYGPRMAVSYGRGGGAWWPYGGGGLSGPLAYSGWDDRSYQREVSVILREVGTGRVVYETRAAHLGRWPVDRDVLPVMFSAALSGFPQPPAGLRRVNIDVPR